MKTKARKGAVLLEYTILLVAMALGAWEVSYLIVTPSGELGTIGNDLCCFFHRCVSVISVPYP